MTALDAKNWHVPPKTTNRVLFACWLAILAEGYDVGVLGAVLPALAEYRPWGNLTPLELGGLGSYALVGMMLGAMTIGTLSDRIGRRRMLLVSLALFSAAQLGAALAATPEIFGAFRLIGGLGMGGIIPIAAALTIEYSAPKRRSFNYGLMYSGYSLGILAAALVALALLPTLGWRWVVGIGALPLLLLPVLFWILPESIEYLMAKGRRKEAAAVAARLEIIPFREADWVQQGPETVTVTPGWKSSLSSLFSRGYLRPTIFFWIALFSGMVLVYGLNTWLPAIMKEAGYDLGSSLTFLAVFSLAAAIGGVVLGRAADVWGKKLILVTFYLVGGAGILLLMFPNNIVVNYGFVALAGIGSISTSLVLTGWVAEYYPAHTRATATGWALSFARIGAISGPLIGGWIGSMALPFQWNFAVFAAVAIVAAVAVSLIPLSHLPSSRRRQAQEAEEATGTR